MSKRKAICVFLYAKTVCAHSGYESENMISCKTEMSISLLVLRYALVDKNSRFCAFIRCGGKMR